MTAQAFIQLDEPPTGVLPPADDWRLAAEAGAESTDAVPALFVAGARKAKALFSAPALAICTGALDANVLQQVDISGARDVYEGSTRPGRAAESEPGVVIQLLSSIRRAFGGSVADLAAMLSVRRPTIYAWMDGKSSPQSRNRARLDEVGTLAKYWISKGRGPASEFLAPRPADAVRLQRMLVSEELPLAEAIALIDELIAAPQVDTSVEAMIRRHGLRMPSDDERKERFDRETGKRIARE